MTADFFKQPILNSPYEYPARHWKLDPDGQPTLDIIESRRPASFITPIPKSRRRTTGRGARQRELDFDEGEGLSSEQQRYEQSAFINEIRAQVHRWRQFAQPSQWGVTPETAILIQHWRNHAFSGQRPFFCQVEAVETAIWLAEVAPHTREGKVVLERLNDASAEANPGLFRIALKLATGAGKTTVMAMLIAWQTINAARRPTSKLFSRGFLVVTPGLTIKERLRVLLPNDPDNYYTNRELVPPEMAGEIQKALIVITNYHAFKRKETLELSRGGRALLQGPTGAPLDTTETEGQMIKRVLPELMGLKNLIVLNDEAHHCYREKVQSDEETETAGETDLNPDEKEEAEKNRDAARLWISGLEALQKVLGIGKVYDLSATPFFLRGSGYPEGTLFPWVVSDFSLMDAIESGIVKLPRVPVVDNLPTIDLPTFRNLWENIRREMPKKGRAKAGALDPGMLPTKLQTALEALYGHYEKTFALWQERGLTVPPCFIVVCQNCSISKLVYDYITGYFRSDPTGSEQFKEGKLALFRNFESSGQPLDRPRTLLIDSEQLESGEGLDPRFKDIFEPEVERFRREKVERSGDSRAGESISDTEILREVMNTVGRPGTLGASIRCVVSVSMLTEGWDTNTVTHVLGVRAFGTQLLCEQVIGRALRRQSYELNDQGLFPVEYADVFGIPFDFNARPVIAPPQAPREMIRVHAVSPERDPLEIRFPRVLGYRVELPEEILDFQFGPDHHLTLSPEVVGPSVTQNQGIIGQSQDFTLKHLESTRQSTIVYELTKHLLEKKFRDPNGQPKLHLFGQLKSITRRWLDECLKCVGGTYPAQILYAQLADRACEKIMAAITESEIQRGNEAVIAMIDPYNPTGSSRFVRFNTSKPLRYETSPQLCHINWVIADSTWELELCRVVEAHPQVRGYVKNQGLGLEVPYRLGPENRVYLPDFVVLIEDGHGPDDLLHLLVEIKGYRREDAAEKKAFVQTYWVPGVNRLGSHGRWSFAEFDEVFAMESEFAEKIRQQFARLVETACNAPKEALHG